MPRRAGEIRWKNCENSNEYCRTEIFNLKNIWNIAVNLSELEIEQENLENMWNSMKMNRKWKSPWTSICDGYYVALFLLGGSWVGTGWTGKWYPAIGPGSGKDLQKSPKILLVSMGLIRERYRFMISDRSRLNNTIVCLQCGKPNDKPTIWGAFVTHPIKIGNVGYGWACHALATLTPFSLLPRVDASRIRHSSQR